MKFDIYMQQLTKAVNEMTSGRTAASYQEVRECLKACIAADSEITLPAMMQEHGDEKKAVPALTQGSDGFYYYMAYTEQQQADAADSEVMMTVPFVNFLAIVHGTKGDPKIGGVILNPGDNGGCAIMLRECIHLLDDVIELLDNSPGQTGKHAILQ